MRIENNAEITEHKFRIVWWISFQALIQKYIKAGVGGSGLSSIELYQQNLKGQGVNRELPYSYSLRQELIIG